MNSIPFHQLSRPNKSMLPITFFIQSAAAIVLLYMVGVLTAISAYASDTKITINCRICDITVSQYVEDIFYDAKCIFTPLISEKGWDCSLEIDCPKDGFFATYPKNIKSGSLQFPKSSTTVEYSDTTLTLSNSKGQMIHMNSRYNELQEAEDAQIKLLNMYLNNPSIAQSEEYMTMLLFADERIKNEKRKVKDGNLTISIYNGTSDKDLDQEYYLCDVSVPDDKISPMQYFDSLLKRIDQSYCLPEAKIDLTLQGLIDYPLGIKTNLGWNIPIDDFIEISNKFYPKAKTEYTGYHITYPMYTDISSIRQTNNIPALCGLTLSHFNINKGYKKSHSSSWDYHIKDIVYFSTPMHTPEAFKNPRKRNCLKKNIKQDECIWDKKMATTKFMEIINCLREIGWDMQKVKKDYFKASVNGRSVSVSLFRIKDKLSDYFFIDMTVTNRMIDNSYIAD